MIDTEMYKWKVTQLDDICTFENGDRGKNYPSKTAFIKKGIPFINAGNLEGHAIDEQGLNYISKERFDLLTNGKIKKNDILFCLRGSIGKFAIVQNITIGAIASSLVIIRTKDNLCVWYLMNYLRSILCKREINQFENGAAQPNLSARDLKQFKIPLPPLPEQQKIAAILDAADKLRQKDQQLIEQYNALSQSLFLEMFGDVFSNSKNFKKQTINNLSEKVQIGPFGSQLHKHDYIEGGVPLINPIHIVESKIKPDNLFTLSQEKYESLPNYHLKVNDLIMARRGEMGRCALIPPNGQKYFCGTGSLFIRPSNECHSVFLLHALTSVSGKSYLERNAQGVTMMNLNKTIILNLEIGVPNIFLQNQFAERIQAIEAQKQQAQASLKKSDDLFNSLLQRAFKGELTKYPGDEAPASSRL